jgi:hypothetical protein
MKNFIARLCTPYYTEADLRFAVATAKCEIERLNKALDFWKSGHMEMTSELFAARRALDTAVDEYIKCEEKVVALTAERDSLQEGLDGWYARYLDMETQCDAAMAAVAMKPICVGKDLEKMSGESGVLRDLLAESLSVIKTIDGSDECECDLLESLCDKIKAAITPQAETGDLL